MIKKYGSIKLANFPIRLFDIEFSKLMQNEQQLQKEFNFSRQELAHIIKQKPTLLIFQEEYDSHNRGILALKKVFQEDMGYSQEMVKSLIVKYPVILSKTTE